MLPFDFKQIPRHYTIVFYITSTVNWFKGIKFQMICNKLAKGMYICIRLREMLIISKKKGFYL